MLLNFEGDILQSSAQAIVNPVNCVGVMGKGLAKQIADYHPDILSPYVKGCKNNELRIGTVQVVPVILTDQHVGYQWGYRRRYIINFPTKQHWREVSALSYIQKGMRSLTNTIAEWGFMHVAIPPLGCGLGGLAVSSVLKEIEQGLGFMVRHDHILIELYGFARRSK